jgi:NAD+ synthetase
LHKEIENLLIDYRSIKNFNAQDYIKVKADLLNKYMHKFNLKSCVVAVSGGIDSAIVLGIVNYASKLDNSPIQKILPVCLPVSNSVGATGQELATNRGVEVCNSYNLQPFVIELSNIHNALNTQISDITTIPGEEWALGQLVAHTRTPTLYYCATLLTQEKLPAIICGTTNRDEGLYLGYFGKASDGLVDVQVISDLHKSEVYKVANELNVPSSILNVTPQGDMYDGRSDEEVFGAPYDFVEYYLYYLTLSLEHQTHVFNQLSIEAQEQFTFFKLNLENLHRYNRHKYFGCSPAVHLDLDYMAVPESWKTNCSFARKPDPVVNSKFFVGLFKPTSFESSFYNSINSTCDIQYVQDNPIYTISNALSDNEIEWFKNQCDTAPWVAANQYGKIGNNTEADNRDMSLRASFYHEILADLLFKRISPHIPHLKINDLSVGPRILSDKDVWVAQGVNGLFRYIRYGQTQHLVAHYDDTYQYHNDKKTLLSMIIYLEDSEAETRFIIDPQHDKNEILRDYRDWDRLANPNEVALGIPSKKGDIIIFDHRVLHDATPPKNQKTIIRTDIVFEAPQFGFDL